MTDTRVADVLPFRRHDGSVPGGQPLDTILTAYELQTPHDPVPVVRLTDGQPFYLHRVFSSGQAAVWNPDTNWAELLDATQPIYARVVTMPAPPPLF